MMDQLEQDLRNVVLVEPPLGIDPDRITDLAVRDRRNRRAAVVSGAGVLAVAGLAAGTIAFTSGTSRGTPPASATSPSPAVSVSVTAPPTTTTNQHVTEELRNQMERNVAHLRQVLPGIMPDARHIEVTYQQANQYGTVSMTAEVTFTDSAGAGSFLFTVSYGGNALSPLEEACNERGPNGEVPPPKTHPDGTPLRCDKLPQPGGDTVVIEDDGPFGEGSVVPKVTKQYGTDYRSDDLQVNIWNNRDKPGGGWRSRFALDDSQIVELVTDRAFTLG